MRRKMSTRDGSKHAFIDLFAGIGGMRLGFERNDMTCVFSSEWDANSQKTYEANFGERPHGDITKIEANEIPAFDVLLAGFPCQPFSSIGRRQGFEHPTQGTLFYDVVRIIKYHEPKAFLLENVKGLVNHDQGRTWAVIQDTLDELGYGVHAEILDASDYGLPQRRERIYIVGFRKDIDFALPFEWPQPSENKVDIGSFVESGVVDRSVSKRLQASYIYKLDDGRPEVITTSTKGPVKTLVASYHKIQRLTGTFVADGPTGLRLLTENECKGLMGFPKDFKIPVSRTQMYRQFGNSVAVPVIQLIATQIKKVLDSQL
jgi:DNA (cytosine-5)-methyltransferase 1